MNVFTILKFQLNIYPPLSQELRGVETSTRPLMAADKVGESRSSSRTAAPNRYRRTIDMALGLPQTRVEQVFFLLQTAVKQVFLLPQRIK